MTKGSKTVHNRKLDTQISISRTVNILKIGRVVIEKFQNLHIHVNVICSRHEVASAIIAGDYVKTAIPERIHW